MGGRGPDHHEAEAGHLVVDEAWPIALRGRDGGSQAEVGEEGLANALRAGDGGSSRSALIAHTVTAKWAKGTGGPAGDEVQNLVAHTLTAGSHAHGVSRPGRRGEDDYNVVAHTLTAEGHDASEDGTGRGTPLVPFLPDENELVATPIDLRNAMRADGETGVGTPGTGIGEEGDAAGTLATLPLQAVATYRKAKRAATDQDDETWVEDTRSNTLNTFDGGDTRATELVLERETAYSITPESGQGADLTARETHLSPALDVSTLVRKGDRGVRMVSGLAVRRLTPKECERLQGLPDDWTAGHADSVRYRFCGNGGAVPVMEWILARLGAVHDAGGQP